MWPYLDRCRTWLVKLNAWIEIAAHALGTGGSTEISGRMCRTGHGRGLGDGRFDGREGIGDEVCDTGIAFKSRARCPRARIVSETPITCPDPFGTVTAGHP